MPPSPLNPPLGGMKVRGQNALKCPLNPPHTLKSEGARGHRCGGGLGWIYKLGSEWVLTWKMK